MTYFYDHKLRVKVLHPTQRKIGHFGDVSQASWLGMDFYGPISTIMPGVECGRISFQTTEIDDCHKHVCIYVFTRWCSLNLSHRESTCLRQWSVTAVCIQRVVTHHSSPNTSKWNLYLTKHCIALIVTIFQNLCIWNVRISIETIKICIKHLASRWPTRFITDSGSLVQPLAKCCSGT